MQPIDRCSKKKEKKKNVGMTDVKMVHKPSAYHFCKEMKEEDGVIPIR